MGTREPSWPAATLLGRLSPNARDALLKSGNEAHFLVGEFLLTQGTPGDFALLLTTGGVKIMSYLDDRGVDDPRRSPLLAVRVAGDLIGEMAVLDGKPRSATVVAATKVSARRISKDKLSKLIRDYPDVGSAIRSIAHDRLRWANRRRTDIASEQPRVRVARVLIDIADIYGKRDTDEIKLDASLTQSDIASLAGVSLSTTEKVFRSLRDQGLVRTGNRKVAVTDLTGLQVVAQITPGDL